MFKDISLDEFKKTVVNESSGGKSFTTDNEYFMLRNYIINYLVKDTKFLNQFKGFKIKDRIELEKTITETLYNKIDNSLSSLIRIEVLIINNTAEMFFIHKKKDLYGKEKLLFDFSISI